MLTAILRFLGLGFEAEHLDLDFPDAGRQIERVAAGFIGVGDNLGTSLTGGHGGAGNELIGGPNRTALLDRGTQARSQQEENEEACHSSVR